MEEKRSPQYIWYLKNKDKVLKAKKDRYANDPLYAEEKRKKTLQRYYQRKALKTDEA